MDSVALVGRLLISLAVVLGLMWLIARRMKRGGGRGRNGKLIELLSRQQLTRSASVAVVRVMDQALIVGVTDGQVAVLGETDLGAAQAALATNEPARIARPARPARAGAGAGNPAPTASPGALAAATTGAGARNSAPTVSPGALAAATTGAGARNSALAGSALSPATWRQTLDTLRDLTARRT